MRSFILSLLLMSVISSPAQEAIGKMTRDRAAGYIDELLLQTKNQPTCDTCRSFFAGGGLWIREKGMISISSAIKYPGNDTRYITAWNFDPALIDTVIVTAGEKEFMRIEVKFLSKIVTESKQKSDDWQHSKNSMVDHFFLTFMKDNGQNAERMHAVFLRLKELSIKENTTGQQ